MELNQIFYENEYNEACDFCFTHNYTIQEIEADENGRRFKIVEIPQPTEKQLEEIEIESLKNWFNTYYAEHEQKYRRLHTLNVKCDDGSSPYQALIQLYNTAEINRKRIQELESKYDFQYT